VPYDEDYYRDNGQAGDRPALGYYVRLVRRYVGDGPYLDFGCGTGHLVRRLSALGPASGFEVSDYSAERARATSGGCVIHTSTDDLPVGHFGGVTAIHVLEHLPDEIAVASVAAWRRALRPGGRALVVMPDPAGRASAMTGERWLGHSDVTHVNLKPHAEWRAFLEEHGMRVLAEGSDGMWNVPYRNVPKLVDAGLLAVPALVQFLSGRLFLAPGSGESSVFVLQRA
jgi:SAM-dependent methyltransferase